MNAHAFSYRRNISSASCRILALTLLFASSLVAQSAPKYSSKPGPLEFGDARAVVLFFIASDCPISNRSLPEMRRVEQEFTSKKVRFWFVYPNVTETRAAIAAHQASYSLDHDTTDPDGTLARLTGANTTPEVSVLVPQGSGLHAVYTGRIDNRNLNLGTERPAATRHDLEDALTAVLGNHPVPPPGGPPVGCYFVTSH